MKTCRHEGAENTDKLKTCRHEGAEDTDKLKTCRHEKKVTVAFFHSLLPWLLFMIARGGGRSR